MPPFVQKNVPLAPRTTLGVGGSAEYLAEVSTFDELREVTEWAEREGKTITVLAGGSNVLVADEGIKGLVIVPKFVDLTFREEGNTVYVTAGSGLVLDAFIQTLVEKELWGLENLSAIPGSVGGVPIQNVGAYGVEASGILESVEVFNVETCQSEVLTNTECDFGYRDSIFKKPEGKKYIVTHATFRVSKNPKPNIGYKDVQNYFDDNTNPTLQEIRNAIKTIRAGKFPDWHELGTAGSFFKNPVVSKDAYARLTETYPDMPGYEVGEQLIKIPLGWILDHVCNLRGYTKGKVGLYKNQALVLVCERGTSASEIESFAQDVSEKVFEQTHITIEREVTKLS